MESRLLSSDPILAMLSGGRFASPVGDVAPKDLAHPAARCRSALRKPREGLRLRRRSSPRRSTP